MPQSSALAPPKGEDFGRLSLERYRVAAKGDGSGAADPHISGSPQGGPHQRRTYRRTVGQRTYCNRPRQVGTSFTGLKAIPA